LAASSLASTPKKLGTNFKFKTIMTKWPENGVKNNFPTLSVACDQKFKKGN
jgi:hypothetical protein